MEEIVKWSTYDTATIKVCELYDTPKYNYLANYINYAIRDQNFPLLPRIYPLSVQAGFSVFITVYCRNAESMVLDTPKKESSMILERKNRKTLLMTTCILCTKMWKQVPEEEWELSILFSDKTISEVKRFCGVSSRSTMFATHPAIFRQKNR